MSWVLLGIPLGIVLLYFASDWLVKGAKGLAFRLGISPFIVGLTVVAFGSSAPECITSVVSSDTPSLILGNVIGSNIANVGLAIGLSALICPLVAKYDTMRLEITTMVAAACLLFALALFGNIVFLEAVALIALLMIFLFVVYRTKKDDAEGQAAYAENDDDGCSQKGYPLLIAMVVVGLVLLYYGATFFIDGATELAKMVGISDLMVGLIVVAIGTSLPEICICLMAASKGENELAVSNIVGSCIFNVFFVLGVGALLTDIPIADNVVYFHLPVMILLAVLMYALVRFKNGIGRAPAAVLIGIYVVYVAIMAIEPSLTI
ncbi:MAG: calcium/sodium antiporter [archaeon]|nr:calcium/sodium antiporter [archaeon]